MQSTQILLAVFLLSGWSNYVRAISPASSALSCDSVALGSQTATKWTVRCITEASAIPSSAYFNPSLVKNYIVNSGTSVEPSESDLHLSSAFSEVDTLISSSITTFSLLAASGFTPDIPVTIVPTALAELSALQTLHLEGIPVADSKLHLVLPTSIQQISIINCGLDNFSLEFADGSAVTDSGMSFIDLRENDLDAIPQFIFELPSGISTIDLRSNKVDLSAETSTRKKQLTEWIEADILQLDSASLASLTPSSQEEKNTSTTTASDNTTHSSTAPISPSSGSNENVAAKSEGSSMDVIPVTILSIGIPALVAVGIMLAFVVKKRRRMQDRDTDAILDLPHPFDKTSRDRSETSGHFTAIESELSRSRMSSGEGHQFEDRDSCVIVPISPTDMDQTHHRSTSASADYADLRSPQEMYKKQPMKRQILRREDRNSLELLSTYSTASATAIQNRIAARTALRSALESLLSHPSAPLTVNAYQYSFNTGIQIEESPLAFFIDCRLAGRISEDTAADPAPLGQLVLKIFIEEDADLAGRESYALSCLQHDELTRAFAPRLFDDALEYELEVDTVKLSCCILVLDKPSCTSLQTHLTTSREPLELQICRVVSALRALHVRGLVHGAFHTDSLVACSPDGRLKFWGLEHASRAGHKIPCPDSDLLTVCEAECIAPELATLVLEETPSSRTSPSLDIWSLGVLLLKLYAAGRPLVEFKGCSSPLHVFERLSASDEASKCFFSRSIAQFVSNDDMKELLAHCLHRTSASRPSVEAISKHKLFQAKEREVSRPTTVKSAVVPRMLSAIIEEKPTMDSSISSEPEREASGKEQEVRPCEEVAPEPLPPSLWLFLPPKELETDLTSAFSIDQWVAKLTQLQQQRADELRFPLVFMCESCESDAVPCSISASTKYGASVPSSLLPLVMALVRETMLFLEARAISSGGLNIGEASGLEGPQQWKELRVFYSALERMELATVNPVNEVELAPMEKQLKTRDQAQAQEVLDKLIGLIFCEEKREYVRNLLDALVSDEDLVFRAERSSWAALRRCDVSTERSSALSRTRWLCSHHAPQESV
ncbi:hypothetical protein V7S43_001843 [Phytophthora oleae]|uniref:Protein kinase domain-containing protein n=1 Tax=Phytophthora oleae TaxID=2107226 RepID=A0ABD3G1M3_9STRA